MGIIKSLPSHTVSWNEAVAHHLQRATPGELAELRTGKTWHALGFSEKFARVGILKAVFAVGSRPYNDYERAVEGMAPEVQTLGRAACSQDCGACVWFSHAGGEISVSESTLNTRCVKPGCSEAGLEAIDEHFAVAEEAAKLVINDFNNTPPAKYRAQAIVP